MLAYLAQQHLPKPELPVFDGNPLTWVEFIVKFRDVVHLQQYLTDIQKSQLLLEHLRGEAKRAVKGYANDLCGYVLSLKTLKRLFGQRATIAQAVIGQVTKGKVVQTDDTRGLCELYFSVNDCLITLQQLNYDSDLHSSETLRQATHRLPSSLTTKWAEHCLHIRRRHEEPNLKHLGKWLQDRMLARKEAFLVAGKSKGNNRTKPNREKDDRMTMLHLTKPDDNPPTTEPVPSPKCQICQAKHFIWKCRKYQSMQPAKKFDLIKSLLLCFNCLKDGHKSPACYSTSRCLKKDCSKKHHSSLHKYFDKSGGKSETSDAGRETVEGETAEVVQTKHVGLLNTSPRKMFLQIVPVCISTDKGFVDTYAVLDTCSDESCTMMREEIATILDLPRRKVVEVNMKTIKDPAEHMSFDVVTVTVGAQDGSYKVDVAEVCLCPADRFNMPSRPQLEDSHGAETYTHLDGISVDAVAAEDLSMLIGADVPEAVLAYDIRRGNAGQHLAVKTMFGWTLFGPSLYRGGSRKVHCALQFSEPEGVNPAVPSLWDEQEQPPTVFVKLVQLSPADGRIHQSLEKFWVQQHCGILSVKKTAMSEQDVVAEQTLEKETRLTLGHYEVPMLWNSPDVKLPKNKVLTLKRWKSLRKRLRANPDLFQKFQAVIHGYLTVNPPYARRMSEEEANQTSNRASYLSMHPVINPHKPGKVRVVNDAAAVFQETSLNKSLVTGPELLSSLVGILLRIRNGPIAVEGGRRSYVSSG